MHWWYRQQLNYLWNPMQIIISHNAFIFIPSKHDLYFYNNGEQTALSIDYGALNQDELRRTGLLSDYVTTFEIDPSTKTFAIDKIVTADITITVDRSVFSQTLRVRLRNRW